MALIFSLLRYFLAAGYFDLVSSYRIDTVDLLGVLNTKAIGEDFETHALENTNLDVLQVEVGDKRRQLRLFWFLSCMAYCAIATALVLLSYYWFGPGAVRKAGKNDIPVDEVATDSSESDMEATVSSSSSRMGEGYLSQCRSSTSKNSIILGKSLREKKFRRAYKHQWLIESSPEQVSNCAAALLCALVGFTAIRMGRRYRGFRSIHFATDAERADYVAANVVEIVTCFVAMGLAFCAMRQRANIFYWPAFLFFCFYILACNLPPFQWSCNELEFTVERTETPHPFIRQAHKYKDCTLQGITAQETLLCAILVLPFLVPRQKMLSRFAFAWVVIYIAWTCLYHYVTGVNMILTIPEHICRVGVLSFAMATAVFKKFYLEKSQRNIFVHQKRSKDAVKRMFNYLQYMVPEHVILPMIANPNAAIAEKVNKVSILFILISEFDQFAQTYAPQELLRFLNDVFSKCDAICESHGVTKIETVGEEYVACVGVVPSDVEISETKGHGEVLKKLFAAADKILKTQSESTKLRFKMGMHTGPVVAGVIGKKLPRFRLFGDTINTSARMMQKSINGKLQFGSETFKELPETVVAKERGEIEMKGKGSVMTYFFDSMDEGRGKIGGGEGRSIGSITERYCKEEENVKHVSFEDCGDSEPEKPVSKTSTYGSRLQFDELLKKMEHASITTDDSTADTLSFNNPATASALSGALNILSEDAEGEWFKEYHASRIVKKFGSRLNKQIILFAVLTLLEIAFMFYEKSWLVDLTWYSFKLPGWARMPLFLGYRLSALGLLLIWRFVLVGSVWLESKPRQVQTCILTTACLVCLLLYFSYSALVNMRTSRKERENLAPFDQIFNLNFIIAFYLITGQQNLTFKHSLFFIALAVLLMVFSSFVEGDRDGLRFRLFGKFFLSALAASNSLIALKDEQSSRERYKARRQVDDTKMRIEGILNTLMPPLVVEELRRRPPNELPPSHDYKHATIAQSDLCGFTKLASSKTPVEVVEFMSELFGSFDVLTDQFGVYKVETIGDAYIAGMAEKMLTPTNQPANVILFGLAMVDAVNAWASRMGVSVRCRVGVHHGACVGGIVGNDMQRYHLFGHLMSGLEILESTAPEGMVQVSPDCKDAVENDAEVATLKFTFELRKEDQLQTSKGEIHTYAEVGGDLAEVGGRTFIAIPLKGK